MNTGRWTGVALLTLASALLAQESGLSASPSSWNGMSVHFVTKLEPPDGKLPKQLPGGVMVENSKAHHIIDDAANHRCFGYDLDLKRDADGATVQLRIEPLTAREKFSCRGGSMLLALPKYPVIPGLKVGDTVALDLLVNPSTGQKIVEYLTVQRVAATPAHEQPHDFTLTDVQLSLDRPRVLVNGKLAPGTASFQSGTAGAVVWLYLEGHGRFVLSLIPYDKLGFQRNGKTEANALTFREASNEYRVECSGPVAPGQSSYNLFLVHEPGWQAYGASDAFELGSADNPGWVIGKH